MRCSSVDTKEVRIRVDSESFRLSSRYSSRSFEKEFCSVVCRGSLCHCRIPILFNPTFFTPHPFKIPVSTRTLLDSKRAIRRRHRTVLVMVSPVGKNAVCLSIKTVASLRSSAKKFFPSERPSFFLLKFPCNELANSQLWSPDAANRIRYLASGARRSRKCSSSSSGSRISTFGLC